MFSPRLLLCPCTVLFQVGKGLCASPLVTLAWGGTRRGCPASTGVCGLNEGDFTTNPRPLLSLIPRPPVGTTGSAESHAGSHPAAGHPGEEPATGAAAAKQPDPGTGLSVPPRHVFVLCPSGIHHLVPGTLGSRCELPWKCSLASWSEGLRRGKRFQASWLLASPSFSSMGSCGPGLPWCGAGPWPP